MKRRKNILAVLLAVTVMATAMPGSAIAAPVDGQTTEVSAKAGTEKAEKKEQIRVISITDPKLEKGSFARGTKVKDMKLPDKLSASSLLISVFRFSIVSCFCDAQPASIRQNATPSTPTIFFISFPFVSSW